MLAIVFLVGICIGAINGFFIVKVKINALIVTLCMLMIYRGFTYFLVPQAIAGLPSEFIYLGAKSFSGLPLCLIVLLVLFCLLYIVIKEGRFGRELLGIGGNRKAAFGAGIAVSRLQFLVFIFSSLLASLAGLLMAGKLESVTSSMGQGTVFLTIAAALLGGISISGGVFPVIGLLAGILLLDVLDNTLSLLRVSPYIVYAIKGIILFAAVIVDHFKIYFRAIIINTDSSPKRAGEKQGSGER
jgi:ribose/xylose/arabinose/galactoside ABC-type transport system permease subunit